MLSTPEIQAALAKITYKQGWSFAVYDGAWEGQHIVITTVAADAYDPDTPTTLDVHSMLPPIPDVEYLHRWVAWRLARLEVHEMREFLQVDGQPIFDPHAEGADQDRQ